MANSGEEIDVEKGLMAESRPLPSSPLSDDFKPKRTGTITICRKIFSDSTKNVTCPFCKKLFKSDSLKKHKSTCSENPSKESKISCGKCGMLFARRDNLLRHVSKNRCSEKARHLCLFSNVNNSNEQCKARFWHKTALIDHLKTSHSNEAKILPVQNLQFDNWELFENWKDEEERNQYSCFTEQYGEKDGRCYFYCQQDGPRRSKVNSKNNQPTVNFEVEEEESGEEDSPNNVDLAPKRRKKSCNKKGRMKTGFNCISMMKVFKTETGGVKVEYFPTHNHVQHIADLKHQPLTKDTNSYINKHLAFGASPRKILKTLRGDKFSRTNRSSSQALTRNDFINIKTLRERKRVMAAQKSLSSDDATAVRMQVKTLMEEEYNPVLIYKPFGEELLHGPESAVNLPKDTFMLGLQTKEQADIMRMASQTILIVDATHDMDQYGCQLLNVVGVDELNRGYPLAHLITSKMDEKTLKFFFEAIKLKLPDLEINCVITDDDPALINSMNAGFDELIRHILCDWHFKRTIQKELHSKVRETELEDKMFKELCVIIDCSQESEFNLTLDSFIKKYVNQNKTKSFINYFKQYCIPKKCKWAKCFRRFPHGHVDTTMYVESFHNILKTTYLKRKPNKRVETLLNLLLEVEEDYYTRRQTTICTVAPREQYFQYISERHLKGVNIPCDAVQEYDENGLKYWIIKSQSLLGVEYKVFRNSVACTQPGMCFFQCHATDCHDNLCAHMYMCTCPDDILLCKHIHKVHSKFFVNSCQETLTSSEVEFHYNEEEIASTENNTRQEKEEEDLLKSVEELAHHIKTDSVKKLLYPYLRGNIAAMLAQCRSVVEADSSENIVPQMTATIQRSSREKLQCQVKPFEKKKLSKKNSRRQMSRTPKYQEKSDIKRALLAASGKTTSNDDSYDDEPAVPSTSTSQNVSELQLSQFCVEVQTTASNQPTVKPKVQFVPRPIFVHGKPSSQIKDKHNVFVE